MTKKSIISTLRVVPLLIILCLLLNGCGCKHEWVEANCETPKTCSLCEETEGEALGHTWLDATCEVPKTCSLCKKTEGEALGHTWLDATCEVPKTCSVCEKTEGELAAHKWEDATTETPKTCSVCKKTEGERIITDARFKTTSCKALFGKWQGVLKKPGKDVIGEDFTGTMEINYSITFNPDGTYKESASLVDKDKFVKEVEAYYTDTLYAEFSALGYDQTQADAAMEATYGMDVKTYAKMFSVAIDYDALFAVAPTSGVYYVDGGKLYSGASWDATLDSDSYTLSNSKLTIESLTAEFPDLVFTYVSE